MQRNQLSCLVHRIWRKKIFRITLSVLVILLSIGLTLPFGLKLYLQKWLEENGAETAAIKRIRINPFLGSLRLDGVDVQTGGQVVFANSSVSLDIGLTSLFGRKAFLQKAALADVIIDIERYDDGRLRIGSYTIAGDDRDNVVDQNQGEPATPWIFQSGIVDLSNVTVRYAQPDFKVSLVVDKGSINRLDTGPESGEGTINIEGSLNNAPISLQLEAISLSPVIRIAGTVGCSGFDLGQLGEMLQPYLSPFSGQVTINGKTEVSLGGDDGLKTVFDGILEGSELDIGGSKWQTGGAIKWNGQIGYHQDSSHVAVDTDGRLELNGPFFDLEMEGGKMRFANRSSVYEGTFSYTGSGEKAIRADGALVLDSTGYSLPDNTFSLEQEKLGVRGKLDLDMEQGLRLGYTGSLEALQTTVSVDNNNALLQGGALVWQGDAGYEDHGSDRAVTLDGTFTARELLSRFNSPSLEMTLSDFHSDSDLIVLLEDSLGIKGNLTAGADELSVAQNGNEFVRLGRLEMVDGKGDDKGVFKLKEIKFSAFQLPQSDQVPVGVTIPAASINGLQVHGLKDILFDEFRLQELSVDDKQQGRKISEVKALALLNGIWKNEAGEFTADKFRVNDGGFLVQQGGQPMVSLAAMDMTDLSWSKQGGFICEKTFVDSLFAQISREKATAGEHKKTGDKPAKAKEPGNEKTVQGVPVVIKMVEIGGESGFSFTDNTLERPFSTRLILDKGEIRGIDLNRPEQPFTYDFSGKFDQYSPLAIKGEAAPLAKELSVKQELILQNYSLQQVSPYVVEAIGTFFESGRLDLTSTMHLKGTAIDLDNTFVIKELEAKTVNSELAAKLNNKLPVPLDMAITMLEDSQETIELDVPVSGDISDLSVGVTDVIVLAMSKAITLGVAPYLAYTALGPTGALVFLGATIGKSLLDTSLPSLEFDRDQVVLTEDHQRVLGEIGKTLEKERDTKYSICAKVALSELGENAGGRQDSYSVLGDEKLRKQLFELGQKRSMAVVTYLQENFKINMDKVMICNPGIEYRAGQKSVVEFKQ